jgi:signal transduction histidine kinase
MDTNGMNFLRWLIDAAVLLWFFHPPAEQQDSHRILRLAGVILCLLATLPLYYWAGTAPGALIRYFYRAVIYTLTFRLAKGLPWDWCIYYSLVVWLVFNICSHAFLASALYLEPAHFETELVQVLLFGVLRFAILAVVGRGIPFAYTERPGFVRFGFVFFLCCVELYIRVAQRTISVQSYGDARVYLILLQVLLGAALVFFERFLYARQLSENERLAAMAINYRYQNAIAQQAAEEDLRRIHHDMKNHLLVIRDLAQDNGRLDGYINGLMKDLSAYDYRADTGNSLLDGLLGNKIRMAAQQGIECAVEVDFRPCAYMADADICSIFGNILDNAIEAASQVPDPQARSIRLKSARVADQYTITCSNYYTGQLQLVGGLPQTTKSDRKSHGIGLASVRRCVEKYGGVLSLQTTPDQCLRLAILLPLEDPKAEQPANSENA